MAWLKSLLFVALWSNRWIRGSEELFPFLSDDLLPDGLNVCNVSEIVTYQQCLESTVQSLCTANKTSYFCCDGWTRNAYDTECKIPICKNLTSPLACTHHYSNDSIKYRDQSIQTDSGGTCKEPDVCGDCNPGFYADGSACLICPAIEHCHHRKCDNGSSSLCDYCEGEVGRTAGERAYTSAVDGGKSCKKACSWRADSTLCFPGNCSSEVADECTCHPSFSGNHCQIIDDVPNIPYMQVKLTEGTEAVAFPSDPNIVADDTVTWTNIKLFTMAACNFDSTYKVDGLPIPPGGSHYLQQFVYGIVSGFMELCLIRDSRQVGSTLHFECPLIPESSPLPTMKCQATLDLQSWGLPLRHNDSLKYTVQTENGGRVMYKDLENNEMKYHSLEGKSDNRTHSLRFDFHPPTQCISDSTPCDKEPFTAPNVISDGKVDFQWDYWFDELSGLDKYRYQLYFLTFDENSVMRESQLVEDPVYLDSNFNTASVNVTSPGLYSLIFSAFDRAGNQQSARRIIFYDNEAAVSKQEGMVTYMLSASSQSGYTFITEQRDNLTIKWTGRFINSRHRDNKWLNQVDVFFGISAEYDDGNGNRTTSYIDNIEGIVRFEVAYTVFGNGSSTIQSYTPVPNIHDQSTVINVAMDNGDKIEVGVRAYDILDNYEEDNIIVYKDTTEPVLENLWLTHSDLDNINVYSQEELKELNVEWEAYDPDSGLQAVSWCLYDIHTNTEHGNGNISPGVQNQTLEDCEEKFKDDVRVPACYCTPFHGCYNKNFHFQPIIGADGLHFGNELGIHDGDYSMEVNVTNWAFLSTSLSYKITIDVTPPQTGIVHDGNLGSMDIDFQQNRTLDAHWGGFFDRESGVLFYRYGFSNDCLTIEDLAVGSVNELVSKTIKTRATFESPADGQYHVTVAAFNRAYSMSDVVCSDGVVVDNSKPDVKEIIIDNIWVLKSVVKDTDGNVWLLENNGFLHLLDNITDDCREKATLLSDVDLYPVLRGSNGNIMKMDGYKICSQSIPAIEPVLRILPMSAQIKMRWTGIGSLSGIYDFKVGVSSASDSVEPDLFEFTSTRQQSHFLLEYTHIGEGSLFFLMLKAIGNSGVESDVRRVGPMIVDVKRPVFTAGITLKNSDGFLVASWPTAASWPTSPVFEHGHYSLAYSFAVGKGSGDTELIDYRPLSAGGGCFLSEPPLCTAIKTDELDWDVLGHHTYHISVKVENVLGFTTTSTSPPFYYDSQLPSPGVVKDIDTANVDCTQHSGLPVAVEDIDFQVETNKVKACWSGFSHPYHDISYSVGLGTESGKADVVSWQTENYTSAVFDGLTLETYKKYYFTVTALTVTGNVSVSSDGVAVIKENVIIDVEVRDGHPCTESDAEINFSHHAENTWMPCLQDIDFQTSTNVIKAYWTSAGEMTPFVPDAFWAIEENDPKSENWNLHREFEFASSNVNQVSADDLLLQIGKTYRVAIKLCARQYCYKIVYSNGVTITPSPPQSRTMQLNYQHTDPNNIQITATFEKFHDIDIEDKLKSESVMAGYEWSLTDDSHAGRTLMPWQTVGDVNAINTTFNEITVSLAGELDFTKCWRFSLRGYTYTGLSSVLSTNIIDCYNVKTVMIKPRIVIDAVGEEAIYLAQNDNWLQPDAEYTYHSDLLSAVWPSLRHHHYNWAVLEDTNNSITYYKTLDQLQLPDPCSHSQMRKCGSTDKEYVNVNFEAGLLTSGKRYMFCIHANKTTVQQETWTYDLPEISACSDGIVVDLTEPVPGKVWVSSHGDVVYQTSLSDLTVSWNSFVDVEAQAHILHSSGISHYKVSVGHSPRGQDIQVLTDVGVVNQVNVHNLHLHEGHRYFATVEGNDFAGHAAYSVSQGITVDNTPPIRSNKPISINGRHITSVQHVRACWEGVFSDEESGIAGYKWSVGSYPGYEDIMSYQETKDICGTSGSSDLQLHDGHAYYISVMAYNGASLTSIASSWAFIVDTTPPVPGQVHDGKFEDLDFQAETTSLYGHWNGFYEAHSTIREYYVSVGTCPNCDDIQKVRPVGLTQEVEVQHISLASGSAYFVTVRCCNTADLCTSVSSDGVTVDPLPPSPGHVLDWIGSTDIQYQGFNNYLGAKWFGFSDSQSRLMKYELRAGTEPGGDNVLKPVDLHIADHIYLHNLPTSESLPEIQPIYITVRAYNFANLSTEVTSNGFVVDTTPPVIYAIPALSDGVGSMVTGTLIHRTSLTVKWGAEDEESFIARQYLSIAVQIGEMFSPESTELNGIVRQTTFTGLDLHDGSSYFISLIACNAAQLCTEAVSEGILVDSTPPLPGMFAVDTCHAAELQRQINEWMSWTDTSLKLAVLGFSDLHSGIDHYWIGIGRFFMGIDLNKGARSPQKIDVQKQDGEQDSTLDIDEGDIHLLHVDTERISNEKYVYVHIWAVNKVGLSSLVIHSQFELMVGGSLQLVRRCSSISCLGHCVCAPHGNKCPYADRVCHNITADNIITTVEVLDISDLTFPPDAEDTDYISTDTAMAAMWRVLEHQRMSPLWYEWSIGFSDETEPVGVFEHDAERVWFDIGQRTSHAVSLPADRHLLDGVKYSFFVRAWYDEETFEVFKSDGVYTDLNSVQTTNQFGSAVKELVNAARRSDVDFFMATDSLFITWENKFVSTDAVEKFKIYLSTFPGGYNSQVTYMEVAATETVLKFGIIGELKLMAGTRYYTNVIAYSFSGLQHIATSDGFVIDMDIPIAGVVSDGKRPNLAEYQASLTDLNAFWHGFTDLMSGIASYHWCAGFTVHPEECDVSPWQLAGLHTDINVKLESTLDNGVKIYSKVYVMDQAGYRSPVVISNGITVDETPPLASSIQHDSHNILLNPSFQDTQTDVISLDNLTTDNLCSSSKLLDWSISDNGCAVAVTSEKNPAHHGNVFILLHGAVSQTFNVTVGQSYQVVFYISHVPVSSSTLATSEGFLEWDNKKHIFLTYIQGVNINQDHGDLKWQQHVFYFDAEKAEASLTIGSTDSGLAVDDVQVTAVIVVRTAGTDTNGYVDTHMVAFNSWSSIHAAWYFEDLESPITNHKWAIGYVMGGIQLQKFEDVGLNKFAYNSDVALTHDTSIHVTVLATNAAGLTSMAHSSPLLVDLTPPVFRFVHDGISKAFDVDFQASYEISVTWDVVDAESGIEYCEWAIGTHSNSRDVQAFTRLEDTGQSTISTKVEEGDKLFYVTIRCHNKVRLSSWQTTDGVHVITTKPSAQSATVNFIPMSITHYPPLNGHQSDTSNLRLKVSNFSDAAGIDFYKVEITGPSEPISRHVPPNSNPETFISLSNLALTQGVYHVSVIASNVVQLQSEMIISNITIVTEIPQINADERLTQTWNIDTETITVTWNRLFISNYPLYYEISAGSRLGSANIVQWQKTVDTQISLNISKPLYSTQRAVHLIVHAINHGGLYNTISEEIIVMMGGV